MREQVKMTSLNPYSKLFIKREKSDIIYFNSKGAQAYNFYMIYINGEAKTISIVKKKEEDKYKIIKGIWSQFSLFLSQKKKLVS